ncbi:hypothetical protein THAOC_17953, partial [Thalassiosira oceanica]
PSAGPPLESADGIREGKPDQADKMSDQLAALLGEPSRHDEVFLLYEGDEFKGEFRKKLTHVRVAPHVTKIPNGHSGAVASWSKLSSTRRCGILDRAHFLKEGLQVIGEDAFGNCTALRSVTVPLSVIELQGRAFLAAVA